MRQSGNGWICNGITTTHEPVEMTVVDWGWECPTCGKGMCKPDEPKYEAAGPDDPHPGELFRYPPRFFGSQMVMYRGGETWARARGEDWQLITPWRVPQPATH